MNRLEMLRDYFVNSGLLGGYNIQLLDWVDSYDKNMRYFCIAPDGGLEVVEDLGRESNFKCSIITPANEKAECYHKVIELIEFVRLNPAYQCLDYIMTRDANPVPIFTADNRIVFQLSVRIVTV